MAYADKDNHSEFEKQVDFKIGEPDDYKYDGSNEYTFGEPDNYTFDGPDDYKFEESDNYSFDESDNYKFEEQDDFNLEQNYTGTIRENLERYRSDNVTAAKARQSSASRKKKNKEVVKRRKAAVKAARKGKTVRVVVRLTLAILVIALCVVAFLVTYKLFYDVALDENNKTKVEITIPEEGITHEEVAQFLYENGCISDPRLYKYRTYIYDANYVPGTYKVSPSYTTEKIINILSGYDYSDGTMDED